MKLKIALFLFFGVFPIFCNSQVKNSQIKIEESMISKGDNFPDFSTKKDSLNLLLLSLHSGYTLNDFQSFSKFDKEKIKNLIRFLESKNWVHKINNAYKPTVFIANSKDGKLLYNYAKPISRKITKLISKNLTEIKQLFDKTEISKNQNFQEWSFLILSNVLLDSWQIENIENFFLKQKERPLRNGNYYYYMISENENLKKESFGIYGNQYQKIKNEYVSVYGNNRNSLETISLDNIISKSDNAIFEEMAKLILPDLLRILDDEKIYIRKIYTKSGYEKEITFEEFFIWWYHFIYTQSTNEMNSKKILTIPTSGNFEYVYEK